jgi:hypothetical protein
VNLTDGEVLSSKCSDIFIDCERLDAVGIVSGASFFVGAPE